MTSLSRAATEERLTSPPRASPQERLAELVVELSGAHREPARNAIRDAMDRYGDAGDNLINVADAIVTLRAESAVEVRRTR